MIAAPLAASPAGAEPYVAGVAAGPRVTPGARDGLVARVAGSAARRWDDRWHLGVHVSIDASDGGRTVVTEEAIEPGVVLHRSSRVDVLVALRAGHAWFRLQRNDATLGVHAAVLETVVEIRVRVGASMEVRVAPLVPSAYRSGMWHLAAGPELGLSWRL